MKSEELVGTSSATMRLREAIVRASNSPAPLLITGASGSGKELTARLVHQKSRRSTRPFIVLDCSELTQDEADEALFGSDAADLQDNWIGTILGSVDQADGGTLLLKNIEALPDHCQRKFSLLLANSAFERAQGNLAVEVDVRVIVATTVDLSAAVMAGELRRDLSDRLKPNCIDLPSLSARRDDIPSLVLHFLKRDSEAAGLPMPEIEAPALAALQAANWPGNVRELRNTVERLATEARATGGPITLAHVPNGTNGGEPPAADGYVFEEGRAYIDELFLFTRVMRFDAEPKWLTDALRKLRAAFHRTREHRVASTAGASPKLIGS
jgi:two-component system, NtrC family, nitrogen regulation response regulator NtrX